MSELSSSPRLRYLFNRRTGRTMVVPIDQGIGIGAIPGLYDMQQTVQQMAGTGVNAIAVPKGLVRSIAGPLRQAPDLGLIVHLCASTSQAPDPTEKQLVCTVQEALALGADGVSVHVNIGSPSEGSMLRDFAEAAERCADLHVPLLAMIYARGPKLRHQFSEAFNAQCARVAYEIGADFVKVHYTGDPRSFSRVAAAVPIPVVIAGGPEMDSDEAVLKTVRQSIEAGGAGICLSRAIFGSKHVAPLCRALNAIVHDGASYNDALDLLHRTARR